MKVLVVITQCAKYTSRTEDIKDRFSSSIFDVHVVKTTSGEKRVVDALKYAKSVSKGSEVIVISDRVVPNASARDVQQSVIDVLNLKHSFDFCFLSRSQDLCQKSRVVNTGGDRRAIVTSYARHGTEATLYTPEGRDRILSKWSESTSRKSFSKFIASSLSDEECDAIAVEPCLFRYDIVSNASKTKYYSRSNTCAPIQTNPPEITGLGTTGLIILIAVIIVILITAWALICVGPKHHHAEGQAELYVNHHRDPTFDVADL